MLVKKSNEGTSKNRLFFSVPLRFLAFQATKHALLSGSSLKTEVFRDVRRSVSLIFCFLSVLAITLLFTACTDDSLSYRVFFESNGGQHEAGEYIVTGRTVYQPGDPKKAGAVFIGWFIDAALTKPYNFYRKVTKDFTLYAKWAPGDKGSGHGNGTGSGSGSGIGTGSGTGTGSGDGSGSGTGSGPDSGTSGGDSGSGSDGGGTDSGTGAGTDTGNGSGSDGGSTGDSGVATVSFDSKGGSTISPRTVHIGDALNMDPDEIPTRTGSTFDGWYTDDGTPYVFSSTNPVTSDITLHANWVPTGSTGGKGSHGGIGINDTRFTVSFETNGGSLVPSESVRSGGRATQPSTPTKVDTTTGYFFGGWYTDDDNPYDFFTPVRGDITLYAKWVPPPFYVIFDTNGGSPVAPKLINYYGQKVEEPDPPPEKPGYKLVGWYTDKTLSNRYNFNTELKAVITLYARWVRNDMVLVEKGSFMMGSPPTDGDAQNGEKPQHEVNITKSFYMAIFEVTQELYKSIMVDNPSVFPGDNLPVDTVSWYQAVEFCNKLSENGGLTPVYRGSGTSITCDWNANGYRLPTEAEWEYAAKGGAAPTGEYLYSGSNNIDEVAWYKTTTSGLTTHDTGDLRKPNDLGIFNMSGNVWEWCWDWYNDKNYYGSKPSLTDPKGPNQGTPGTGNSRVMRGGCYSSDAKVVRSSNRWRHQPGYLSGDELQGFRIVCNGP